MKIRSGHYNLIRDAIDRALRDQGLTVAEVREKLARDPATKDVERRLTSELLHIARLSRFICDYIYPYANDDHLHTAVRHIARALDQS